jgi:hypothetical protein
VAGTVRSRHGRRRQRPLQSRHPPGQLKVSTESIRPVRSSRVSDFSGGP